MSNYPFSCIPKGIRTISSDKNKCILSHQFHSRSPKLVELDCIYRSLNEENSWVQISIGKFGLNIYQISRLHDKNSFLMRICVLSSHHQSDIYMSVHTVGKSISMIDTPLTNLRMSLQH
jgi:hypothetical protein